MNTITTTLLPILPVPCPAGATGAVSAIAPSGTDARATGFGTVTPTAVYGGTRGSADRRRTAIGTNLTMRPLSRSDLRTG